MDERPTRPRDMKESPTRFLVTYYKIRFPPWKDHDLAGQAGVKKCKNRDNDHEDGQEDGQTKTRKKLQCSIKIRKISQKKANAKFVVTITHQEPTCKWG